MADWYYIGHYGQLGPLTREQIDELVHGGVVVRETYVWRSGMTDWLPADRVPELQDSFRAAEPFAAPPPPPGPQRAPQAPPAVPVSPYGFSGSSAPAPYTNYHPSFGTVRSDRNRAVGGVLQLVLPGIGRIYLGYAAIGVLQLVLSLCGVGIVWSFIDGLIILTGGVKMDGYGRHLAE